MAQNEGPPLLTLLGVKRPYSPIRINVTSGNTFEVDCPTCGRTTFWTMHFDYSHVLECGDPPKCKSAHIRLIPELTRPHHCPGRHTEPEEMAA